ncbi:hypothetical protein SALBM135S_08672 [Streptomyces alboniger]
MVHQYGEHPGTAAPDRTAAEGPFVGRAVERAAFTAALRGERDAAPVLYLHGMAGTGKTALLHRFAREAGPTGRTLVRVNGACLRPSPRAFVHALQDAAGTPDPVILVDDVDRCAGLEEWLRESFLPELPHRAVTVLAGRRAPDPLWTADPGWASCARVRRLGRATGREADRILDAQAVPRASRPHVLAFAAGNPLALHLAAADAACRPEDGWPSARMTAALLARLVGTAPSARCLLTLRMCALAGAVTEDLLRTELGAHAAEMFGWLREQPFTTREPAGLVIDDVVAHVVEEDALHHDGDGFLALRARLHTHLRERTARATAAEAQQALGALLLLHRGTGLLPPEREAALLRHPAGPSEATVGGTAGAAAEVLRLRPTRAQGEAADPVVRAAWDHVRRHGPLGGAEVLAVLRPADGAGLHDEAATGELILRRVVLETLGARPAAWIVAALYDDGAWEPLAARHGLLPLPVTVTADGRRLRLYARDTRVPAAGGWERGAVPRWQRTRGGTERVGALPEGLR